MEKSDRRPIDATAIQTLTGNTVLLARSEGERYRSYLEGFAKEWAPQGQRETVLVQSIGHNSWRIESVHAMEAAIYARERHQYAHVYQEEPEAIRAQLIELEIYQLNERQIRGLQKEETRLRRQRDRDLNELRYMQAQRHEAEELEKALAVQAYQKAKKEEEPFDPAQFGFVFSIRAIESFISRRDAKVGLASRPAAPSSRRRPC